MPRVMIALQLLLKAAPHIVVAGREQTRTPLGTGIIGGPPYQEWAQRTRISARSSPHAPPVRKLDFDAIITGRCFIGGIIAVLC